MNTNTEVAPDPSASTQAGRATKTYLITGGAGFLGINLVRYLMARGHTVVSLDIADFTYPERDRITEIKGDIRDKIAVDRAMEGVDIVIHTAAALPLYKAGGHLFNGYRWTAQRSAVRARTRS